MSYKIGIIGSGVVGSATGKGLAEKGFDVTFCDINKKVLDDLKKEGCKTHNTNDSFLVDKTDVSMIAVPTPTVPLDPSGRINLDIIKKTTEQISKELKNSKKDFHVICYRSTIPPTTCEKILIPLIEQISGRKIGENVGVSMNPEFLRAFARIEDFKNPVATILGSSDKKTGSIMRKLYASFGGKKVETRPREAEAIKYWHNLINAFRISAFNEVAALAKKQGLDAKKIREKVASSETSQWSLEKLYKEENYTKVLSNMKSNLEGPLSEITLEIANMQKHETPTIEATEEEHWANFVKCIGRACLDEVSKCCKLLDIDDKLVKETITISAEACWNQKYGSHGSEKDGSPVPYGGSCLPKDTIGLFNHMKDLFNVELPVLKACIEVNENAKTTGEKAAGEYFKKRHHDTYDNY